MSSRFYETLRKSMQYYLAICVSVYIISSYLINIIDVNNTICSFIIFIIIHIIHIFSFIIIFIIISSSIIMSFPSPYRDTMFAISVFWQSF